jgi:hypothetical protein
MFILIPALLSYAAVTYQDFRFRAVNWLLFLAIAVFNLLYVLWFRQIPFSVLFTNTLINVVIITAQFLFLKLYFSLREKKLATIIDKYVGLGDIIFYLLLCMFFPPLTFIAFHTGSLLCCLLFYPLYSKFNKSVPLAGLQSLLMIILLCYSAAFSVNLNQDIWLLNLLQYV